MAPVLLWLWCRLAVAALIQSLMYELPHAASMALKRQKRKGRGGQNLDIEIHIITHEE